MYDKALDSDQLRELLMQLLENTTPYKDKADNEKVIRDMLPGQPYVDDIGNAWLQIKKDNGEESETLFCCHMDTVGQNPECTDAFQYDGKIYAMSKTVSCLGGDDRCGVLCLTAMYCAGIPGTYLFHIGEEKGTIGAKFAAKNFKMSGFKRAVEFDRRGTNSVITVMMGGTRTCSEEFALALAKQLNDGGTNLEYKPDDTGSYTDVFEYNDEVPEVTNLSVGYQCEHSNNESIAADWLIDQLIPALYTVKWEELPVVRNPKADNTIDKWGNSRNWNKNWEKKQAAKTTTVSSTQNTSRSADFKSESRGGNYFPDDYLREYNYEHGLDTEDDTQLEGLSVFDTDDLFGCCHFCNDKCDDIASIFIDNKCFELCSVCRTVLVLDDVKYASTTNVEIINSAEQKGSDSKKEEDPEIEVTFEPINVKGTV